ncbi:MAG: MFS transporter [Bacteroidota bacterium]
MSDSEKIKFKEKISYSFGDFACSMFWTLFSMYLLFFYTDVFGITAAAAGTMFLITRFWDTVSDPMMGMIADRTKSKWGKFRPYLLFVAVPFAIVGFFTFTTPDLSPDGKIIYAYITYTFMMMVYTAINIPYASMLGVISRDSAERTSLASFRLFGGFTGGLFVTATANSLVEYFRVHANLASAYQKTISLYAVLAAIFFILTFAGTEERLDTSVVKASTFKEDLQDLIKNKPWFNMLGAAISVLVFNSLRGASILYYFKYLVGDQNIVFFGNVSQAVLASTFMSTGYITSLAGVALAIPVSTKLGKKNTFMLAGIICTVLSILFFYIPPGQIGLIFFINIIISISSSIVFPLIWAMYADVSDYSEWKTGHRATGLVFSSSSMAQKMGWTIGGALSGWILAVFGFQANTVQSAESILGIRLMISLFAGVGALFSVGFMYFYPLSESYMENIKIQMDNAGLRSSAK